MDYVINNRPLPKRQNLCHLNHRKKYYWLYLIFRIRFVQGVNAMWWTVIQGDVKIAHEWIQHEWWLFAYEPLSRQT